MRHSALVIALGFTALGLLFAACGSDGKSNPNGTPVASVPAPTSTAAPAAGSDMYDVVLSGGLQGTEWHTADEGSGVSCGRLGDQLITSVYGNLSGATYGLGTQQDVFTPGAYSFPPAITSDQTPSAQVTTASDSGAQWDLAPQSATAGTITIAADSDGVLTITIDGDFADIRGGDPAHVVATFTCTPQVS